MLNRKIAPEIKEIRNLKLPPPTRLLLDNGVPVYVTNMGTQDIIKLEIAFLAGRPFESKKLASRATAGLLKEGTRLFDSSQIAEITDFYGGSLSVPVNLDTSNLVLFSLKKHFDKLLPVAADMIAQPVFPESELALFKKRNTQRLQLDLTKNDVLAYRKITEHIFGKEHPYGYNSDPEMYESLTRADLVKHFEENYVSGNCVVFLSGKIESDTLELVNKTLGQSIKKGPLRTPYLPLEMMHPGKQKLEPPGTLQTAIRIGRRLFNRHHPDFKGFFVLNMILGGYFGSRLMANIREEKGYTYNIYSTVDAMMYDGCFYVGTEVGNEFAGATIKEIYKEFEKLQQELVEKEEMEMVRNYVLGNLLTALDGPFNVAEVTKSFVLEGIPFSDFEMLVETVQTITPHDLRELARKYLNKEEMWEVVVGE
ncbi:MAG: insulinase family protein [Bacteroidetes bacterium]|nr:MAG: insulinase family protein [Bacteroidota bacterium]